MSEPRQEKNRSHRHEEERRDAGRLLDEPEAGQDVSNVRVVGMRRKKIALEMNCLSAHMLCAGRLWGMQTQP